MNQVAVKQERPIDKIRNNLNKMDGEFQAALPAHVSVDKFKRVVMTAVQSNDDLLVADQLSLFKSCVQCAADGLLPDGKEAALVIFKTKVGNDWVKKVQYMPMIKGLIKLARNSGEVSNFTAQVVYEHDKFTFDLASEERPRHEIDLTRPRGKLLAAYAIANFKDGSFQLEVMTREEIERVKAVSKGIKTDKQTGEQSGIWISWEPEMWRKTVAKRLMKYLSLSPDAQRAIEADNAFYDLEKLNAPTQKQLPIPATLADDWKTEPVQDDAEMVTEGDDDIKIKQTSNTSPSLSNDYLDVVIGNLDDVMFLDDAFNQFEEFATSTLWKNEAPQERIGYIKNIFVPKILELGFEGIDIPTTEGAYLCMMFATDKTEYLNGLMNSLSAANIKLSADALAIKAIRQKELSTKN